MQATDAAFCQNFVLARHNVLEAFATLENAVMFASQRFGTPPLSICSSLGQRLDALGKVKASPKLAKAMLPNVLASVERAKVLLGVRNDIVHSHQHVANIGEVTAVYLNTGQSTLAFPSARILTLGQHERLRKEVLELARAINPPSPPQPLPVATAGP